MNDDSISAITSRAEFQDAVRSTLGHAEEAGSREIFLVDPTFADWPLGERGVVDTFARWARSGRTLTIMAHSFDELPRRHVRFVEWRRHWTHVVQCRADEDLEARQIPILLFVPGLVCVRLVDGVEFRGTESAKASEQMRAREAIDALLQRSVEAFPVTALGL
jgi:hypothetical protein